MTYARARLDARQPPIASPAVRALLIPLAGVLAGALGAAPAVAASPTALFASELPRPGTVTLASMEVVATAGRDPLSGQRPQVELTRRARVAGVRLRVSTRRIAPRPAGGGARYAVLIAALRPDRSPAVVGRRGPLATLNLPGPPPAQLAVSDRAAAVGAFVRVPYDSVRGPADTGLQRVCQTPLGRRPPLDLRRAMAAACRTAADRPKARWYRTRGLDPADRPGRAPTILRKGHMPRRGDVLLARAVLEARFATAVRPRRVGFHLGPIAAEESGDYPAFAATREVSREADGVTEIELLVAVIFPGAGPRITPRAITAVPKREGGEPVRLSSLKVRRVEIARNAFSNLPYTSVQGPPPADLEGLCRGDSAPDIVADATLDDTIGRPRWELDVPGLLRAVVGGACRRREVRIPDAFFAITAVRRPLRLARPLTAPRADPIVAAAGDVACGSEEQTSGQSCHHGATADMLVDLNPDVVAALGDLQYNDGTLEEFRRYYGPTWGALLERTKPAVGNHEYHVPDAQGYFDYFGAAAGPPRTPKAGYTLPGGATERGYYSYDVANWHVVVLNTECRTISCARGSAQVEWLQNDLAASTAQCTLAYFHRPRFSSGINGDYPLMQPLWAALANGGVDVALAGHEHSYERLAPANAAGQFDPKGVQVFIVGSGGHSHTDRKSFQPMSQVFDNTHFGILAFTLQDAGYKWRFIGEPGTAFGDSGTGSCH